MEENNKIDKISNVESADLYQEENSFDFKAIITMFILNWQWFALSVFIFVCGALIYLRYTTIREEVQATKCCPTCQTWDSSQPATASRTRWK